MKSLLMSNQVAVTSFWVSVSPGFFSANYPNGSYFTPTFTCTAGGGVGPYEYLWTVSDPNVQINSPTSDKTKFSAGGNRQEVEFTATCTVKDTGNGNVEKSAFATIFLTFGDLQ